MATKALKLLMFFLLFFSLTVGYSQSVVQKYNSLYNRYEYFDGSGNMIGYKTYNSLMKQWEFYSSDDNTRKTDFGKYVSPINLNLAASTLRNRQARYDANREMVINYLVDLGIQIEDLYESSRKGEYVAKKFYTKVTNTGMFVNVDFSSSVLTQKAITLIKRLFYKTLEEEYY
ncbi:hypothetical protein [Hyunsoonleella rubra]|uniref:Uncharacterized protein n=1 Tax=Hyunsoonleella rubra TaxID=1737062 RepID=A0ABW5TC87_9FLAO